MILIDGSYGEGGGQILRTSASLAAITGQTVRVEKIRAGRAEPGLRAQHLVAISAAMRICAGHLEGGEVGSTEVTLTPGAPVQPGTYELLIGTAGSTTLVLQTLLPPLLQAGGESRVTVEGGTHNPNAPSVDYLRDTFLPAAGLPVDLTNARAGFFPRGGGRVEAVIRGGGIAPIRMEERGGRLVLTATVTIGDALPDHILDRAEAELTQRAGKGGWRLRTILRKLPSTSPGMAVHLHAEYRHGVAGVTVLGRKGMPTERVVEEAWKELEAFDATGASVDEHLADQLVMPALLAEEQSVYRTNRITEHLRTMAWIVPQFGAGEVEIDEASGRVEVRPHTERGPQAR